MSDEYEDVSARIPMWNPASVKNETGENVILPATDKSFIEGYYLGSRQLENVKTPGQFYTIHGIHATKIGDHAHDGTTGLSENGESREFWGSAVVNSILGDKITPGQKIRLTYKGVEKSKAGRDYKNFVVAVSKTTEPVNVHNMTIVDYKVAKTPNPDESSEAPAKQPQSTASAAPAGNMEEEDDIPF